VNMSDREGQSTSLIDHIQGGGYRTVNLDPSFVDEGGEALAEALAPVPEETRRLTPDALAGTIAGESLSGETDNTQETAGPTNQPAGVTSQPTIDPQAEQRLAQREAEINRRQAEIDRREQEARVQQAQQALRQEEDFVRQRIAATEDPAEKRAIAAEYRALRNGRAAQAMQTQYQQVVQQQTSVSEESAKAQVIFMAAREAGLPQDLIPLLHKANTAEEMDQMIATFKANLRPAQPAAADVNAARQARIDSGVDAATGTKVGFVPPAAPKQRSGDLIGLIRSREHRLVNVAIEQ
jgi:hypothetical protein